MEEKEIKEEIKDEVKKEKKSPILIIILCLIIGFGVGFGAMFLIGNNENKEKENEKEEVKEQEKENDENKEDTKEQEKVEDESKENLNVISDDLRKDLDKKVELTRHFVVTGLGVQKGEPIKNIIAENEHAYAYFAIVSLEYYEYKTGKTVSKWTSNDPAYGQCYKDSQNGSCYPVAKSEILKYEKDLYNIGEKTFDLEDDYTFIKGDKIYISGVPWNGAYETKTDSVVSVVRNNDVIEYTAKQSIYLDNLLETMTIKYIFKINENGNFYLYSFEKI